MDIELGESGTEPFAIAETADDLYRPCEDCGIDTAPWEGKLPALGRWHWYMVYDFVWSAAGMKDGFLCKQCLESRLERPLRAEDLIDRPINQLTDLDHPAWEMVKRWT